MKFHLKLLWFELSLETPEPKQLDAMDVAAAALSVLAAEETENVYMIGDDDD
ncbi:hypothetical protein [Prescottella equi]|uniref:hypothetical protein n=1 Tax=Rhodococcus hoagii TaxID=43767 RepID=UPI001EEB2B99|nr:hypothetical protein [Prescottella equi]